jgi:hypothetical protein
MQNDLEMTNEIVWYQEYMGDIADELSSHWSELLREALKKIVAEAERRGQVKAWEEAKKLVEECTPRELQADEYDEDTECGYCRSPDPDCGCNASEALGDTILLKIDAKINELK